MCACAHYLQRQFGVGFSLSPKHDSLTMGSRTVIKSTVACEWNNYVCTRFWQRENLLTFKGPRANILR